MLSTLLIVIMAVALVMTVIIAANSQKRMKCLARRLDEQKAKALETQHQILELLETIQGVPSYMDEQRGQVTAVIKKLVEILSSLPEYRNKNREQAAKGNRQKDILLSILVEHLNDMKDVIEEPLYQKCLSHLAESENPFAENSDVQL